MRFTADGLNEHGHVARIRLEVDIVLDTGEVERYEVEGEPMGIRLMLDPRFFGGVAQQVNVELTTLLDPATLRITQLEPPRVLTLTEGVTHT